MTDNPYWDEVMEHAKPSKWPYGEGIEVGGFDYANKDFGIDRYQYVPKYSWTITDPESLKFVAEHAIGGLVDPMAGNGYWAYVLSQLGIDTVCYDLDPEDNHFHEGQKTYSHIGIMDCAEAVTRHPDRTLLLSWPPMNDAGARALRAYEGTRVIYIGESERGCTGDSDMFEMLREEWVLVAGHRPVQWFGIHDYIEVYGRR